MKQSPPQKCNVRFSQDQAPVDPYTNLSASGMKRGNITLACHWQLLNDWNLRPSNHQSYAHRRHNCSKLAVRLFLGICPRFRRTVLIVHLLVSIARLWCLSFQYSCWSSQWKLKWDTSIANRRCSVSRMQPCVLQSTYLTILRVHWNVHQSYIMFHPTCLNIYLGGLWAPGMSIRSPRLSPSPSQRLLVPKSISLWFPRWGSLWNLGRATIFYLFISLFPIYFLCTPWWSRLRI